MHRIQSQVSRLATATPAATTPAPQVTEVPINPEVAAAARHTLLEQQAALNLMQLAMQVGAPDGAQSLIEQLIVSL